MASYCEARSKSAGWLLRIDDIDKPRSVAGSAQSIRQTLQHYEMQWDGEIQWQSEHDSRYRKALAQLINLGLVYRCNCSRKSLRDYPVYPGNCTEHKVLDSSVPVGDYALRLAMPPRITYNDAIQGPQVVETHNEIGDIIIWRRDSLVSYSLACAIDDANSCTEVVRGADLLPSTAAQIAIMNYLNLPVPSYAHIPVALDNNNDKISKHSKAKAIDDMAPLQTLQRAWQFLGQAPFDARDASDFWAEATRSWAIERVPAKRHMAQ